ncbi:MAG: urease accessory protein UreF [Polyangiaceae bacterium]|nr:urease accessory protein UreF [Polyangiaceae bacterium]
MDWLVLQLADSAFPVGGFAHSAGLESCVQHGVVRGRDQVLRFVRDVLWQTGTGALPLVGAAHDAPDHLGDLDELCDAFLSNHVANRASRTQGLAFAATCDRVFRRPVLAALSERIRSGALRGHHAPVSGVAFRALDIAREDAQRIFLYSALRGVVAAAIRLGLVGPHDAQRIQQECAGELDRVMLACAGLPPSEIAQTAPLVDLLQAAHDRLYCRLFQS